MTGIVNPWLKLWSQMVSTEHQRASNTHRSIIRQKSEKAKDSQGFSPLIASTVHKYSTKKRFKMLRISI